MRVLSENFEDTVETVRAFNQGLAEDQYLENQLSYFRAWYYIPGLDMVGPSKFIGYKGMTAAEYMTSKELDGKMTEPALSRWFDVLQPTTPEASYVENLVQELLARHHKAVNRKARFLAPHRWHLAYDKVGPLSTTTATRDSDDERKPIVEVFWRAYLGLYPEDQEALARRITTHVRGPK